MADEFDFSATYEAAPFPGVAFRVRKYFEEEVQTEVHEGNDEDGMPIYSYEYDNVIDYDRVIAVMIGDDYQHIIEVDDLRKLDEDEFCDGCGQIGCGHGGDEE